MEEEEVKFTKNKRLIEEKGDGSHVGGSLGPRNDDDDGINNIRLDKRGLSLYD